MRYRHFYINMQKIFYMNSDSEKVLCIYYITNIDSLFLIFCYLVYFFLL